ncbi:MAG: hypothetical protein EU536_04155 [Promethearchaeota archaeon]|nr:MAG: hypothetical protein EU536_04155 [Candidatus Lokiarchaeota archaeon]
MPPHTYGEIPDSVFSKRMIPIGEHIWKLLSEYGWEWFQKYFSGGSSGFFSDLGDAVNDKFHTAVRAAKLVLDGKISDPTKVYSTWFFPPLIYVRSDLQTGSTKLIYGDSTDITFLVMSDVTGQVELLINGHMEDGIPVDYWYISSDDETFDRRHMKLGYSLREMPRRTKDMLKTGERVIDILRDVRNERSPQWTQSAYSTCMVWVSGGINIQCEPSNWGDLANVWDGLSAKKAYGAPDFWFSYVPWPPLLGTLMNVGRAGWTVRMTGLLTNHQLFIDPFEPKLKDTYQKIPEIWEYVVKDMTKRGVATPNMILNCQAPNLKDKHKFQKAEFSWHYSDDARIKPFGWGLSEDEVFSGIITDITHDTPSKAVYGKEHMISLGIGKDG